ncbi:MAG: transcriptional regulator [Acidobacteriota bacterium]|nr:transcriptional regulator [Acidobacteriota bacterium]
MDRGAGLSGEERKLLELLVLLIHSFESQILEESEEDEAEDAETPLPQPHETLQRFMESRGWQNDVLTDVFGNPRLVGEVMAGRRPISKGQAKALAKLFRVPVKLFVR